LGKTKKFVLNKNWKKLCTDNLGLVYHAGAPFMNQGIERDDIIGEGMIGLVYAAKRFDPKKGFEFSTYACWCIQGAIKKAICNKWQKIRIPENKFFQEDRKLPFVMSLQQPLRDHGGLTIQDTIPGVDKQDEMIGDITIDDIMRNWDLTGVEKKILKDAVNGIRLAPTGVVLGISGERVRQIRLKIRGKLQKVKNELMGGVK
jgi:RNA polymerase sigma factor (sigma-70 family)